MKDSDKKRDALLNLTVKQLKINPKQLYFAK